jgi:hypothetical protein
MEAGDIVGYFVLAGHRVGFTNSQSDVNEFNTFMSQQTFTCVTTSGTAAAVAPTSKTKSAKPAQAPTGMQSLGSVLAR